MQLSIPVTVDGLRTILYCLLGLEIGLAAFHIVLQVTNGHLPWGPVEALFDLDEEASIPTWFSTVQLFAIGIVMMQATLNNRQPERVPNWLLATGAAGFILLSLDEGAMAHERFTGAAKRLELDWLLFGRGRGAWILPYLFAAAAAAAVLFRPLARVFRSFPSESRIAIAGASAMALGAAGFELISYYTVAEQEGAWYELEVAGEELLEMAGASLILYGTTLLAAKLGTSRGALTTVEPA